MSEKFYLEKLYPLQDKVLKVLQQAGIAHYLTGGTVVSRCHFNHRYSDDLDLFLNNHPSFMDETDKAIATLKHVFTTVTVDVRDVAYFRVYVQEQDTKLKIDFVNDVGWHCGEIESSLLFYQVDNLRNILSNKLTALGRFEPKDVIDIIYIAQTIPFNWPDVIEEGSKKDTWVNEVDIMNYLQEVSVERLIAKIAWVETPDAGYLNETLNSMLKDIVTGGSNKLCN